MKINHHIYIIKPNQCVSCGKIKTLADFYTYTSNKNRNNRTCKKCYKEYAKKWRQENPEKYRLMKKKYDAKRRARPGYKEAQSKYYHEWYVKNRKPSIPWLKVSAE